MPLGPHAGIARKATRLAARAVLLAAVVAAVVTPAVADAASVAYLDKGRSGSRRSTGHRRRAWRCPW
jgi:hypothetical protein